MKDIIYSVSYISSYRLLRVTLQQTVYNHHRYLSLFQPHCGYGADIWPMNAQIT